MTQSPASPPAPAPCAYVLVGPTATGKTAVAHELARRFGWALLSADAMQVYRGMDIGTAKPTAAERAGIVYGGLDLADPTSPFSAGDYLRAVREEWPRLSAAPRVLVVGGSGLYVEALIEGLQAPPAHPAARAEAERLLAEGGPAALQRALKERFPEVWAALRDPNNPRRLARAYERAWLGETPPPARGAAAAVLVGLRLDREVLRGRIRERARRMFAGGILDEVAHWRARGLALSHTARQAIGYREAFAVLEGRCTIEQAIDETVRRTCQYAKRQMTWFRNRARVAWCEADAPLDVLAETVYAMMQTHGPIPLHGIG